MKTFPLAPILAVIALLLALLAILDIARDDVALGLAVIFLALALMVPSVMSMAGGPRDRDRL
jgi:ABC-type transport system involved in cytochrome bd biosynthesis fused ATPase/permease subunit